MHEQEEYLFSFGYIVFYNAQVTQEQGVCDCVDNFDLVSGFLRSGYCREMLEGNTTQTFKAMSCPSDDYAVHFLDQKRQKKPNHAGLTVTAHYAFRWCWRSPAN